MKGGLPLTARTRGDDDDNDNADKGGREEDSIKEGGTSSRRVRRPPKIGRRRRVTVCLRRCLFFGWILPKKMARERRRRGGAAVKAEEPQLLPSGRPSPPSRVSAEGGDGGHDAAAGPEETPRELSAHDDDDEDEVDAGKRRRWEYPRETTTHREDYVFNDEEEGYSCRSTDACNDENAELPHPRTPLFCRNRSLSDVSSLSPDPSDLLVVGGHVIKGARHRDAHQDAHKPCSIIDFRTGRGGHGKGCRNPPTPSPELLKGRKQFRSDRINGAVWKSATSVAEREPEAVRRAMCDLRLAAGDYKCCQARIEEEFRRSNFVLREMRYVKKRMMPAESGPFRSKPKLKRARGLLI